MFVLASCPSADCATASEGSSTAVLEEPEEANYPEGRTYVLLSQYVLRGASPRPPRQRTITLEMAIYHLEAQIFSRTDGRSAVACAAYRSGEALHDEREGATFSFPDSDRVAHCEILAPASAPDWARSRASLWNQVEAREKRKDSQLAREFEVALPRELSLAQQLELLRGWVAAEITPAGAIADVAIHVDEDNNNPHAHIMTTMRAISAEGWDRLKIRAWEDRSALARWRESWASHTNAALERAAIKDRVDHRSNADRGISLEPTQKEGPGARGRASRGQQSDRVATNAAIRARNEEMIRKVVAAIVSFAKAIASMQVQAPTQQPKAAAGPRRLPSKGPAAKALTPPQRARPPAPMPPASQAPPVPPVTQTHPPQSEDDFDMFDLMRQQQQQRDRGR